MILADYLRSSKLCHHTRVKQADFGQYRKDYSFTTFEGREYYLNVCKNVQTETWALEESDDVGGFTRKDRGDFSMG